MNLLHIFIVSKTNENNKTKSVDTNYTMTEILVNTV